MSDELDPDEVIAPIVRAGKLSRYRVFEGVCQAGHRRLQVIRTPAGLVMLVRVSPAAFEPLMRLHPAFKPTADRRGGHIRLSHRGKWKAMVYESHGVVDTWCKHGTLSIGMGAIDRQIRSGLRRAVLD